jgi:hypothetical protein
VRGKAIVIGFPVALVLACSRALAGEPEAAERMLDPLRHTPRFKRLLDLFDYPPAGQ